MPSRTVFQTPTRLVPRRDWLKIYVYFWPAVWAVFALEDFPWPWVNPDSPFHNSIWLIIHLPDLFLALFVAKVLLPYTLNNKKVPWYLAFFALLCAMVALVALDTFMVEYSARQAGLENGSKALHALVGKNISHTIFSIGAFGTIALLRAWYLEAKLLNRESLRDQTVRYRLHHHSLLNMVKHIHTRAEQKGDFVTEYLYHLVHLTRYIVYYSKRETVPLRVEVEMLRRYIVLMRNSTLGKLVTDLRFPQLKDCAAEIPPMLFLPLIENAFKHGAARMPEGCRIRIHMRLTPHNELIFRIRNDRPSESPSLVEQGQLQGEGLKLIRNQIEHWKHHLDIEDKPSEKYYQITLTLQL